MLLSARCMKPVAYRYENCSYHNYSSQVCGDAEWQREAIELKVWRPPVRSVGHTGLEELDGYLSHLGSGMLIIFDRRPSTQCEPPDTEITQVRSPAGHTVTLMRA